MIRTVLPRVIMPSLAVAALMLGNAGAVLAAPGASVNVEGKADFVAPAAINVVVDVNCGAGSSVGIVSVFASQHSATGNAEGNGFRNFVSDGTRQQVVVPINGGPWNVGPAIASAQLNCGVTGAERAGEDLGARIDIQ